MSEENKAPSTVKELGIELQGFKEVVNLKFDTLTTEIARLAKALEDTIQAKADNKDLQDLRADLDTYKIEQAQLHKAQDILIKKKPILSTVLWSLFSALLTAVFVYEVTKALRGEL